MDGVTILNTFVCVTDFVFIIPASIAVVCFVLMIIGILNDEPEAFFCMLGAAAFTILCIACIDSCTHKRCEALVSPDVSATELHETYKVIERKGDIWVLEPLKEDDA